MWIRRGGPISFFAAQSAHQENWLLGKMLVSTVLLLGYQLTAPRAGLASIRASAGRMSAAEDAAKAAWLAKQDTPA